MLVLGGDRDVVEDGNAHAQGARQADDHRARIRRCHYKWLAPNAQHAVEGAGRLRVIDGLEAEQYVRGGKRYAVGPSHAVAKFQRVGLVVRRDRPRFDERRLGLLRGAIDPHQFAAGQDRIEIDGHAGEGNAVEGPRLAPQRGDQRAPPGRGLVDDDLGAIALIGRAVIPAPAEKTDSSYQQDAQQCPRLSVHFLSSRPIYWPVFSLHANVAIFAISAQILRNAPLVAQAGQRLGSNVGDRRGPAARIVDQQTLFTQSLRGTAQKARAVGTTPAIRSG